MLNISRKQKAVQSSVVLTSFMCLVGNMPVQGAEFGNFANSTNFAQMSSFSSSPRTQAPVGSLSGNVSAATISPTNIQTVSSGTFVTSGAVFSPTSATISQTATVSPINTSVLSPTLGTSISPMQIQGTVLSNQVYTAAPLTGLSGIGTFSSSAATFAGTIGTSSGGKTGSFGQGTMQTFHNISVLSNSAGVSNGLPRGAAPTSARIVGSAVQGVRNAISKIGQAAGEGCGGAGQTIARLVDDKEHRPEDIQTGSVISGLPSLGSLLPTTVGAVTNMIISAQQQAQLTLFSSANQVLQGGRGQILSGDMGTLLSQEMDTIILHRGKLTIDSGDEITTVKTAVGEVRIKPSTIAIIDNQAGKPLQVVALCGQDEAISVTPKTSRGIEVTARAGQQLLVHDEEMIPVDGAETVVAGGVELRYGVQKSDVSVEDVLEQYQRRAGKSARFGGHVSNPADTTAANSRKRFRTEFWDLLDQKGSAPLQIVVQPGSQVQQDSEGNTKLLYGALFVSAKADTTISTPTLKVIVKRNGLAMIETDDNICRVKSFSGPGDLQVVSDDSTTELAPGQELMSCSHAPSDVEVIPADAIARRFRSKDIVAGKHIRLNDFSILSMVRCPGYRKMIAEVDQSGKLAEKILKTGVVVEMVTKARGQYAYSSLYQQKDDRQKLSSAASGQKTQQ